MSSNKSRKCPKCKKAPTSFVEFWDATIEYAIDEHGQPEQEGFLHPGNPAWVEGWCQPCQYRWRLRGVSQITELRDIKERNNHELSD